MGTRTSSKKELAVTRPLDSSLDSQGQDSRAPSTQLSSLLARKRFRTAQDIRTLAKLTDEMRRAKPTDTDPGLESEIEVLLKEYESLRNESLSTITNRSQILVLGLAIIGAVFAGAMQIKDPAADWKLVTMLFSGAVPMITALVILLWVGEAMRMKRASDFLAGDVEPAINRRFGKLLLTWEQCLKTHIVERDMGLSPSTIIFFLLNLIVFSSPLIGVLMSGRGIALVGPRPMLELWIPWLFLMFIDGFLISKRRRITGNHEDTARSALVDTDTLGDK